MDIVRNNRFQKHHVITAWQHAKENSALGISEAGRGSDQCSWTEGWTGIFRQKRMKMNRERDRQAVVWRLNKQFQKPIWMLQNKSVTFSAANTVAVTLAAMCFSPPLACRVLWLVLPNWLSGEVSAWCPGHSERRHRAALCCLCPAEATCKTCVAMATVTVHTPCSPVLLPNHICHGGSHHLHWELYLW